MANPRATARSLIRRQGSARSRDLVAAGVARVQLSRMVTSGELVRVTRGVYALPGQHGASESSAILVAQRFPEATLCLLTALRLHGLTTQAPFEVWIAIGNKDRAPRLDWPKLRVVRFSGQALDAGVESRKQGKHRLRLTSPAKTVADCFKFRNLVGLDVALDALRETLRARAATVDELWRYARICRVEKVMRPYLEAIASMSLDRVPSGKLSRVRPGG